MPSIDHEGKAFEFDIAGTFAYALRTRRRALALTASEVSRRTGELGYPISRGAIAKMESSSRSGKVDVAELLVLSAALDIPPVLLLFPDYPDGRFAAALPGMTTQANEGVRWVSGQVSLPRPHEPGSATAPIAPPNDGVKLIAAAESLEQHLVERIQLEYQMYAARRADEIETEYVERMMKLNGERIVTARQQVDDAREALWRTNSNADKVSGELDG
jgi:transcriptional regulator with XRE-family HTH domain